MLRTCVARFLAKHRPSPPLDLWRLVVGGHALRTWPRPPTRGLPCQHGGIHGITSCCERTEDSHLKELVSGQTQGTFGRRVVANSIRLT